MRRQIVIVFVGVSLLLLLITFAAEAQRRRAVRHPGPSTRQTTLSIVSRIDGTYSVGFSAWFPVPEGTTMAGYSIKFDGSKTLLGSNTITHENADSGWSGWLWGGFTYGQPLPVGVIAFEVEFTRGIEVFSVFANVPDPTNSDGSPLDAEVYPDGRIFLKGPFLDAPVASLNGHGESVILGWISPSQGYTGEDVILAVCAGFPRSQCWTELVDIPTK